ncbi:MAG TPA: hypothetical protein VIJ51_09645 [Solirubrobacteraceae bacterium]
MSIHIRPTAPLAERALLPADPGLALALAQALLDSPRMFNHARGLWGYTGLAGDGTAMTIQSTGIGGPSAAIVLEELIGMGLERAIRVGTCAAPGPGAPATTPAGGEGAAGPPEALSAGPPAAGGPPGRIGLGDLLIAEAAVSSDGASRSLGADRLVGGDERLSAAMVRAAAGARRGRVVSTDLFYGEADGLRLAGRLRAEGALAVDLETAALFALGARRRVAVGCVLVVADVILDGRRTRLDDAGLDGACERAGRLGAKGLAGAR